MTEFSNIEHIKANLWADIYKALLKQGEPINKAADTADEAVVEFRNRFP